MRRWRCSAPPAAATTTGGGDGGATSGATGATEGAKKAPTLEASKDAKGNVTYCTGKDTSGAQIESVKLFNEKYASQGLKAKLLEFPESADEQRNQFIQRQQAKSGECDIFYSDVIWTAEFAGQKWLLDTSEYVNSRKGEFIPSTLETIKFDGEKYWGVPKQTDARLPVLPHGPDRRHPADVAGRLRRGQAGRRHRLPGRGLRGPDRQLPRAGVAAGGKVLSDDGTKSEINSPENVKALQFMVDGVKSGAAPKAVTTYMEEPARRAFENGRATFQRNWPYAYALGQKAAKVKGKFAVAPYPEFEGAGKAGILGGHNLVISAFSKNPEGAVALIDYLTTPESIKRDAAKYSLAPVLEATYDDAEVKEALPFADELKQAVAQAKSRPVSPVYTQISSAIYKNVNQALSGQQSPQAALEKADEQIKQALETF